MGREEDKAKLYRRRLQEHLANVQALLEGEQVQSQAAE
jgi:hypothetical protein